MKAPDASEDALLQIVDAVRGLTPRQRSRLVRRLRILGLWDPEEFVSDRDRLHSAPALGRTHRTQVRVPAQPAAESSPEESSSRNSTGTAPNLGQVEGSEGAEPVRGDRALPASQSENKEPTGAAAPQVAQATDSQATDAQAPSVRGGEKPLPHAAAGRDASSHYRSPVSGRFIVSGNEDVATQSGMAPLPGQAPEEPIGIIFDGGTRGEPALGYASYAIRWPGMPQQIVRLRFADEVTGAEAEYDTLIAALEATLKRLQDNDAAPESAKLDIRGDSHVVLSQVRGDVEIDEPALRLRCDRVRFLLRRFGSWRMSRYHRSGTQGGPTN